MLSFRAQIKINFICMGRDYQFCVGRYLEILRMEHEEVMGWGGKGLQWGMSSTPPFKVAIVSKWTGLYLLEIIYINLSVSVVYDSVGHLVILPVQLFFKILNFDLLEAAPVHSGNLGYIVFRMLDYIMAWRGTRAFCAFLLFHKNCLLVYAEDWEALCLLGWSQELPEQWVATPVMRHMACIYTLPLKWLWAWHFLPASIQYFGGWNRGGKNHINYSLSLSKTQAQVSPELLLLVPCMDHIALGPLNTSEICGSSRWKHTSKSDLLNIYKCLLND